jgi:hypothetical protein
MNGELCDGVVSTAPHQLVCSGDFFLRRERASRRRPTGGKFHFFTLPGLAIVTPLNLGLPGLAIRPPSASTSGVLLLLGYQPELIRHST